LNVKDWKDGVMERWSNGVMERWKDGNTKHNDG